MARDLVIVFSSFVIASALAAALGAANLGTALAFGQMAFAGEHGVCDAAPMSKPAIAVFAPHPMLTVTLEAEGETSARASTSTPADRACGSREMARRMGAAPVLCGLLGGESGELLRPLLARRNRRARAARAHRRRERLLRHRSPLGRARGARDGRSATRPRATSSTSCCRSPALAGARVRLAGRHQPAARRGAAARESTATSSPTRARAAAGRSWTSPRPRLDSALAGEPDLVKINDWELAEFVRGHVSTPEQLLDAARRGCATRGRASVIVTRGELPALVLHGEDAWELTPPRFEHGFREGCGDAMMGALAATWARTESFERARDRRSGGGRRELPAPRARPRLARGGRGARRTRSSLAASTSAGAPRSPARTRAARLAGGAQRLAREDRRGCRLGDPRDLLGRRTPRAAARTPGSGARGARRGRSGRRWRAGGRGPRARAGARARRGRPDAPRATKSAVHWIRQPRSASARRRSLEVRAGVALGVGDDHARRRGAARRSTSRRERVRERARRGLEQDPAAAVEGDLTQLLRAQAVGRGAARARRPARSARRCRGCRAPAAASRRVRGAPRCGRRGRRGCAASRTPPRSRRARPRAPSRRCRRGRARRRRAPAGCGSGGRSRAASAPRPSGRRLVRPPRSASSRAASSFAASLAGLFAPGAFRFRGSFAFRAAAFRLLAARLAAFRRAALAVAVFVRGGFPGLAFAAEATSFWSRSRSLRVEALSFVASLRASRKQAGEVAARIGDTGSRGCRRACRGPPAASSSDLVIRAHDAVGLPVARVCERRARAFALRASGARVWLGVRFRAFSLRW